MKTTENISLAGYSFTIETDAYQELGQYLDEIRAAFGGSDMAEEIAADIEERISELLREICVPGMVVNLEMVNSIKKRIGDPKEMAQNDIEQESPQQEEQKEETRTPRNRKLYRNIDERVLGGVCSGLGLYFGVDKVIFRLAFLIAFFIGVFADVELFLGIAFLGYICLWIATPAARTAEQKREMKGKPVSLEGYRAKDFELGKEVKEMAESPAAQAFKRIGGVFLGLMLLTAGAGGLLSTFIIPALPQIIQHEIYEEIHDELIEDWDLPANEEMIMAQITDIHTFWVLLAVTAGILFVWFLYNGVMLTFNLKSPSWRPGLVLFIAWIISLLTLCAWTIRQVAEIITTII